MSCSSQQSGKLATNVSDKLPFTPTFNLRIQIAQSRFASVGSLIEEFVSNPIKIKTKRKRVTSVVCCSPFLSYRNLILVRRIASQSSLQTVRIFHGCRRSSCFNFISRGSEILYARIFCRNGFSKKPKIILKEPRSGLHQYTQILLCTKFIILHVISNLSSFNFDIFYILYFMKY